MQVAFSGNLTQDPELRFTKSGTPVVDLRVAENRSYRDRSGEWQTETTFHTAEAWRDLAEQAAKSMHKGDRVMVTGRLRQDEWTTDDGTKRRRTVIEVADLGASLRFATVAVTPVPTTGNTRAETEYTGDDPERPF